MDDRASEPPLLSSWYEAELLAAAHMRELGFADASTTAGGADGGIDVVATGAVAQVKHYSNAPIGSPSVQRLHGAALGKRALFYSLNGYTTAAKRYAEDAGDALFTYDLTGAVRPGNDSAEQLVAHGHVPVNVQNVSQSRAQMVADISRYAQGVVDAGAVVLNVMANLMAADLAAINSGGQGRYVTPENVQDVLARVSAVQEGLLPLHRGDEMPLSQTLNAIIRVEAVVQELASRFDLSFEGMARVGEALRADGTLGSGSSELQAIVMRQVALLGDPSE